MKQICRLFLVSSFMFLVFAAPVRCPAATWHVELDGTGDFSAIQDAVDASSPGDIIQLGAGVFSDHVTDTSWLNRTIYVQIHTDGLTIRGMGKDVSIIGQTEEDIHPEFAMVIFADAVLDLTLEDLTLQLRDRTNNCLLSVSHCNLSINNCAFRESDMGVFHTESGGTHIVNCEFTDLSDYSLTIESDIQGRVESSVFERVQLGMYIYGPELLTITDCSFNGEDSGGNSIGAYIEGSGRAEFRGCVFYNHSRAALLVNGDRTELYDCEIMESQGGNGINMYSTELSGEGNVVFSNESTFEIQAHSTFINFRNNHILTGPDGRLVYVRWDSDPAWHAHMRYNWWGFDNEIDIGERILDHSDNPELGIIVDYIPFYGGPVSSKRETWGSLKAMYR